MLPFSTVGSTFLAGTVAHRIFLSFVSYSNSIRDDVTFRCQGQSDVRNCGSVFGRREAGVPAGIPTLRLGRCREFRRFQSIRHDYIRHSSMAGPIGRSSAFAVAVLLTIQYYPQRCFCIFVSLCLSVCRMMCAMSKHA